MFIFVAATTTRLWSRCSSIACSNTRPNFSALSLKIHTEVALHLSHHSDSLSLGNNSGTAPRSAEKQIPNYGVFSWWERDCSGTSGALRRGELPGSSDPCPRMLTVVSLAEFHYHLFHEDIGSQRSYLIAQVCVY